MKRIQNRRKTIHGEQNSDEDVPAKRSNLNSEQEDFFISVILKHYNVIENKATDKSLTPQKVKKNIDNAWESVQTEFFEQTGVIQFGAFLFNILLPFSFQYFLFSISARFRCEPLKN